jgi:hypothetical protein
MPLSPFDFLETSDLACALPEPYYLTWCMALHDIRSSQNAHQVEQRFQYCRGFLQALSDARVINHALYLAFEDQAQTVWVKTITALEFNAS